MARTNIDIDEKLVTRVMRKYHLKTKREAVNFALKRAAGPELTQEFLLSLRGIGWSGDLDEVKNSPVEEY